jgi:hypothetical protein
MIKPKTRAGDPGQEALNAETRQWVADEVAQGRIDLSRGIVESDMKKLNTWLKQNGVNVGGPYKPWDVSEEHGKSLIDLLRILGPREIKDINKSIWKDKGVILEIP